jgi:hypothetical protein
VVGIGVVTLFVGSLLAIPVVILAVWIWLRRAYGENGAIALERVGAGQPFALNVPAGPAARLLLRYSVAGGGTTRSPEFGFAVLIELTRRPLAGSTYRTPPFVLAQQVVVGRGAPTDAALPVVKPFMAMLNSSSQLMLGPVESSATIVLADVPAGDAFSVRGRVDCARGTTGLGFSVYVKAA